MTARVLKLALLFGFAFASAARAADRPNVIFILSDDQGTLDLGCYGSADLKTPHLDALAARGVRFTQFYTAAPVCSPSRAALLTGRAPIRAGMPTNASHRLGEAGMPASEITIAETLKAVGYRAALFGKWHLGATPETAPLGQGFDEFFGFLGGCIDNYSHWFYWSGPPTHDLYSGAEIERREEGTHFNDLVAREATRFLEESKSRPFFLLLPLNTPHYPLQARARFMEMFASLPEPRRSYAAALADMDDALGKILAKADALGLREKTLVVFASDHGHSTEERANFGGGNAGEFRGAKFSLFEGGIRVPCIASWPGRLPQGETRDAPASMCDWLPTIAELCGVPLPERPLDGASLVPILKSADAATPHDALHWQLGDQWAIREGDWKLIVNARDTKSGQMVAQEERIFLANLAQDASERKNFARERPDLIERLTKAHDKWAEGLKPQ